MREGLGARALRVRGLRAPSNRATVPITVSRAALLVACSIVGIVLGPATALAQTSYAGTWNAGSTRMQVDITSWGPDCGQRPASTTVPASGQVRVTEDGDQLVFRGRQTQRTDGCWSANPAVRRVSSTRQPGEWRVVCRTPPSDSKSETGTYTLTADGDDRLVLRDVSRYDWQLNASRCVGTITSTQVFTRVGAGAATPTPTPTPTPAPERCTPGEPHELRLRPAESRIEPGGEVRFSARVVDRAGCTVPSQRIQWDLRRPASVQGELEGGVFHAARTAAEAEGEFTVVARSGSLRAEATVTVHTADLSDSIARRTSFGVVGPPEDVGDLELESAAGVSARSERAEEEESYVVPIAVGAGALVLVLILVGVVAVRRGRRRDDAASAASTASATSETSEAAADATFGGARDAMGAGMGTATSTATGAAAHAAVDPTHPQRAIASATPEPKLPRVCPVCAQEFEDGTTQFCPNDGAELLRHEDPPTGQPLICPTCRRGFVAGMKTCPTDGEELVPYALFVARHRAKEQGEEKAKICPTCGDRYGRQVTFCGKDGSELVLVN